MQAPYAFPGHGPPPLMAPYQFEVFCPLDPRCVEQPGRRLNYMLLAQDLDQRGLWAEPRDEAFWGGLWAKMQGVSSQPTPEALVYLPGMGLTDDRIFANGEAARLMKKMQDCIEEYRKMAPPPGWQDIVSTNPALRALFCSQILKQFDTRFRTMHSLARDIGRFNASVPTPYLKLKKADSAAVRNRVRNINVLVHGASLVEDYVASQLDMFMDRYNPQGSPRFFQEYYHACFASAYGGITIPTVGWIREWRPRARASLPTRTLPD